MKPLIPILVVATTSLAVASVQFARQASAQRERADVELVRRQKADSRVAELERNQDRLERELLAARGRSGIRSEGPPAGAMAARPGGPRQFGPPAAAGIVEAGEPDGPPRFFGGRGRGPMDSQAGQAYMRSRVKNSLRQLYEDVGTALGLSADKSNQLLDLLADQQTRVRGRPQIPDGETFAQFRQEQQQKNTDEIKALIGADKMPDWAAYQKTIPDREQLSQVRNELDQAGQPMTETQRTEMLAAITEESQRLPRPSFSQGIPQEEAIAQITQWQTDYNEAILDRAQQVLSTEQYKTYKQYQDFQAEMREPRSPGRQVVSTTLVGGRVPAAPPPAPTPRK